MQCPTCQSASLTLRPKRLAFYPVAGVTVIGWRLATLHQASAAREYGCNACGAVFSRRSAAARLALGLLLLAIFTLVLYVFLLASVLLLSL